MSLVTWGPSPTWHAHRLSSQTGRGAAWHPCRQHQGSRGSGVTQSAAGQQSASGQQRQHQGSRQLRHTCTKPAGAAGTSWQTLYRRKHQHTVPPRITACLRPQTAALAASCHTPQTGAVTPTSTASWSSCRAWHHSWHAPATPATQRSPGSRHTHNSDQHNLGSLQSLATAVQSSNSHQLPSARQADNLLKTIERLFAFAAALLTHLTLHVQQAGCKCQRASPLPSSCLSGQLLDTCSSINTAPCSH